MNLKKTQDYPYKLPCETLILASNGCSDYGNKIGEPVLGGFTDFRLDYQEKDLNTLNPISAGNGMILDKVMYKNTSTRPC